MTDDAYLILDYSDEARESMAKFNEKLAMEMKKMTNFADAETHLEIARLIRTSDEYFRSQVDSFKKKIASGEYDQFKIKVH
jgi:hypothetical protein